MSYISGVLECHKTVLSQIPSRNHATFLVCHKEYTAKETVIFSSNYKCFKFGRNSVSQPNFRISQLVV